MELGVQLFGCMDLFRKEPRQFLKHLADIGYQRIEPCIAFSPMEASVAQRFWTITELCKNMELVCECGLSCKSVHAFGDLLTNLDSVRQVLVEQKIEHLVINGPRGELQGQLESFVSKAQMLAEGIHSTGADLWIHNGSAEIKTKIGGKSFFEVVLDRCEGAVGAQVDVGWVLYGGENPADYLKKVLPYVRSIHYKDLKKEHQSLPAQDIHICLGDGCLNVSLVQEIANEIGASQLVDQDYSERGFVEDLARSFKILCPGAAQG